MVKKTWKAREKRRRQKLQNWKITQYICIALLFIWFGFAWYELVHQLVQSQTLTTRLKGFSDEEKREAMFGKFYQFLESCRSKIPLTSKIFLTNPIQFYYFFSSYYLYPRKILIASPDQIINGPEIEKIRTQPTREWLLRNGIEYQIFCDRAQKIFYLSKVGKND